MTSDPIFAAARSHYENFPVASWLLPPAMRPHVAAVYAFARAADDFADEGEWTAAERLVLLDGWRHRLERAASSGAPGPPPVRGEPADTVEVFRALGATIRACALPVPLFTDLLSAFRQDITTDRYASWADLLDYCRRSANPVGRLVLRIAGRVDGGLDEASDCVCTALQLTNFWQDLQVDFDRGRIYLPEEERRAHGAREDDLGRVLANGLGTDDVPGEWRRALASAAARTRALFAAGRPVCDAVDGRLRYELRATWLGGTRILDKLADADYDVVRHRPTLGPGDVLWFTWRMLTWQSRTPKRARYEPL